jgi:anti-sigma-K factor RskA
MTLRHSLAAPLSDLLAAELALGVLKPAPHFTAKTRLAHDAEFAAAYEHWSLRLAPLALIGRPATPSRDLWPNIRRRLVTPIYPKPLERWFWRLATLALAAVAVGLATAIDRQFAPLGSRFD